MLPPPLYQNIGSSPLETLRLDAYVASHFVQPSTHAGVNAVPG